jgi:hypothetical protein
MSFRPLFCAYKKSHIVIFQRFNPARNLRTGVNVFVVMICGMYSGILLYFLGRFCRLIFCRRLLARGWRVWVFSPGRDEIFHTGPDRPWGPFSPLYCSYRVSLPGVKRPGRGVDYLPHLTSRLKKEFSYNSTVPRDLHGLF